MTTSLHVYFSLRSQQAFQRLLDAPAKSKSSAQAGLSSSGGKSRGRPSPLSSVSAVDVNSRDRHGRTVLHLAASATDSAATEFVRILLAHPKINVNLPDTESHWTALHRALYHGNLSTAVLLLRRPDIDVSLKDFEGYTALDLYNSTVEGTKPTVDEKLVADLFAWGANRNATLGVGDGDDRTFPEQVVVEPTKAHSDEDSIEERFTPIRAQQIVMSRLHTAVVTDEPRANLRACGFGTGGRLGPGQHMQYALSAVPQLSHTIVSVALGQDHTLVLTNTGEVLSWGLNRFSQLGYVVETLVGTVEEPIQASPRKVGGMRGKFVQGIAACKTASVCWTTSEVYSWGTNNGQLGYDKAAHPIQILPRVVTKIAQPVLSVTLTDNAMACLLETNDVVCIYNDNHFRVNFPAQAFPSEITAYRPPQAIRNASIQKIVSCDTVFAALSSNGELFTFQLSSPSEAGINSAAGGKSREMVKPQRVWALRKKFSSVKDVALGSDGGIIICTESGHVFVRPRTSGKTSKFQRVPYIQRVVQVAANNTGGFGALRVDAIPAPLIVTGNTLAQDLASIQPYRLVAPCTHDSRAETQEGKGKWNVESEAGDEEDKSIVDDRDELLQLCRLLEMHKDARKEDSSIDPDMFGAGGHAKHGADVVLHVQSGSELKIPAHRIVLAARSPILADVLSGRGSVEYSGFKISLIKQAQRVQSGIPLAPWKEPMMLRVTGCHAMSVLILLEYLYSDNLLTLWDWRVSETLETHFQRLKIRPPQIKDELQRCAQLLQLPAMSLALQGTFKREMLATITQHFAEVLSIQRLKPSAPDRLIHQPSLSGDVILCLEDIDVPCHSAVLRARSPLFQAFFDQDEWTRQRWGSDGIIRMQFTHLKWRPMEYVMRYIYGADVNMFDILSFLHSVDELLEFIFDVMGAANELLLDRLVQICSSVILRRVNVSNVCAVLSEASYYHAAPLIRSLQGYMAQNMETLLENKMLDEVALDLTRSLSAHVRDEQAAKSRITRSNHLVEVAMAKYSDWLALQDIPTPIVPQRKAKSPESSPLLRPHLSSHPYHSPIYYIAEDEMFTMDGVDPVPPLSLGQEPPPKVPSNAILPENSSKDDDTDVATKSVGWKVSSAPKMDMKAIIAEAESNRASSVQTTAPSKPEALTNASDAANWRTPQRQSKPAMSDLPRKADAPRLTDTSRAFGGSPWKTLPTSTMIPVVDLKSAAQTPPSTPRIKAARSREDTSGTSGSPVAGGSVMRSQPPTPQKQGLGPVFAPSRQSPAKTAASSPGVRRTTSSSAAWTLPPVRPIVQPSPSTSVMSFTAIQQLQLEQDVTSKKDKRSLKEIQEEERARQVEDDFLKWWAAEEERIRVEQEVASAPTPKLSKGKGKKTGSRGTVPGKSEKKQGSSTASRSNRQPAGQQNKNVIKPKVDPQ